METPSLIELRSLETDHSEGSDAKVRLALSRLALDVNKRLQEGSLASAEFMANTVAALKKLKGDTNAQLRINCLLDAAQFFYVVGQSFNAIDPAAEAVGIATRSGHKGMLRKGLTFLGIIYADTGNISRAIECYAQALDLVSELGDHEAECIVWINLGVALLYAAQYRDAIACFEHVIHLAAQQPSLLHRRSQARRVRGRGANDGRLRCDWPPR